MAEQWLDPQSARMLSSSFPGPSSVYGTNFPVFGLAYDGTSTERAYFRWSPIAYVSGNITCTVEWYADTATTGAVVFETAMAAITPNSDTQNVETKAFATVNTATDTNLGNTQQAHNIDVTISNLDSIAAGDWAWLRLSRLPADAGDTMAGDAIVTGVRLTYT